MAASYSSFLSSQFYSPVFNTALFDGAFRIYFSQSYESTALKIYHLVQTDHPKLWMDYKKWSERTKKNVFILIYPSKEDVGIAFQGENGTPTFNVWDDGIAIGLENIFEDESGAKFSKLFGQVIQSLTNHMEKLSINEAHS